MTFPGPVLPLWGTELVLFALVAAVIGEGARSTLARYVPMLRRLEPIERGLVDLYLGGAAWYAVAAWPFGLFDPVLLPVVLLAAALASLTWGRRRRSLNDLRQSGRRLVTTLRRPPYLLTLGAAFALLAVELGAVDGIASGNTYDASLLGLYTALTNLHHAIPLTLAPVASQGLAYPQGTTLWLAVAQGLFGSPPIATSLLVTPLFLALAPLGGFVAGRRLMGSESAGAIVAAVLALLAPWTRGLVQGSNDFVVAFPLVLVLLGWSTVWTGAFLPTRPEALMFGGVLGYAAALNPMGSVWLVLTLPVAAALARPRFAGAFARWVVRWAIAIGTALVWVLPSLYVTAIDRTAGPGGVGSPLASGGHAYAFSAATWVGEVDPFLFRAPDVMLSPFPVLRAELAMLLVAGLLLLLVSVRSGREMHTVATTLLAGGIVAALLAAVPYPAALGIPPFTDVAAVTSAAEAGYLLFVVYTLVAAVPIVLLASGAPLIGPPTGVPVRGDAPRRRRRADPQKRTLSLRSPGAMLLVAVLLLLPGAVVTAVDLPAYLHGEYARFSDVSASDVDLLQWSAAHLAPSSRVLAAPGSAAQFLPAYDVQLQLVFPMTLGFQTTNRSYWVVVDELSNGTLDSAGVAALAELRVGYVAVTQANTALYMPFDPAPLIAMGWPVVFHEGDAYLFTVAAPA